jgi:hypothetical protein
VAFLTRASTEGACLNNHCKRGGHEVARRSKCGHRQQLHQRGAMKRRSLTAVLLFLVILAMPSVADAAGGHGEYCRPVEYLPGWVRFTCAQGLRCISFDTGFGGVCCKSSERRFGNKCVTNIIQGGPQIDCIAQGKVWATKYDYQKNVEIKFCAKGCVDHEGGYYCQPNTPKNSPTPPAQCCWPHQICHPEFLPPGPTCVGLPY